MATDRVDLGKAEAARESLYYAHYQAPGTGKEDWPTGGRHMNSAFTHFGAETKTQNRHFAADL